MISIQPSKESVLAALHREQPKYLPLDSVDFNTTCGPCERYNGPGETGLDMWGQSWTKAKSSGLDAVMNGSTPTPNVRLLDDITRWKEVVKFPDLDSVDWAGWFEKMTGHFTDAENKVTDIQILSPLIERLNEIMEFDDALCSFYEEPEAVHEFFDAMVEYKIKYFDYVIKYLKPDLITHHDDWGYSGGLFISVDIWNEFFKERERKLAEFVHSKGVLYRHHSCGHMTELVPGLVEAGVDCTDPQMEINDIKWIKENYGDKICISSGISGQAMSRPGVSEEEIRANVRHGIDLLAPGGCFIMSSSVIDNRVSDIATDEAIEYGRNYYKR